MFPKIKDDDAATKNVWNLNHIVHHGTPGQVPLMQCIRAAQTLTTPSGRKVKKEERGKGCGGRERKNILLIVATTFCLPKGSALTLFVYDYDLLCL